MGSTLGVDADWTVAHIAFKILSSPHKVKMREILVLYKGSSIDDILARAAEFGSDYQSRNTEFSFLGVRRVVACLGAPKNSVELTYYDFSIADVRSLANYLQQAPLRLTYEEE